MMMDDEIDGARAQTKSGRLLQEGYAEHLKKGRKEPNAREAHLFALAMLHRGVTFGKSVREIVLELEGQLPTYWPQP